jgi:hypothetical protein
MSLLKRAINAGVSASKRGFPWFSAIVGLAFIECRPESTLPQQTSPSASEVASALVRSPEFIAAVASAVASSNRVASQDVAADYPIRGTVGTPLVALIQKMSGSSRALIPTSQRVRILVSRVSLTNDGKQLEIEYQFETLDESKMISYCAKGDYEPRWGQGWWLVLPDGTRVQAAAASDKAHTGLGMVTATCRYLLPDPTVSLSQLKFAYVPGTNIKGWQRDKDNRLLAEVEVSLEPTASSESSQ